MYGGGSYNQNAGVPYNPNVGGSYNQNAGGPYSPSAGPGYYPQAPPPAADPYYNNGGGGKPTSNLHSNGSAGSIGNITGKKADEMFPEKQPYNDVWAAILFILHIVALVVIAVISIGSIGNKTPEKGEGGGVSWDGETTKRVIGLIFGMAGIAIGTTLIYLVLMFKFPKLMIIGTFWVSIGILAAIAIIGAIKGLWAITIIFGILFALNVLLYFLWRSRIPFAALMMSTVVSIMHKYPATVGLAFGSVLVFAGFSALWIPTVVGVQNKFISGAAYNIITLFLIFNYYWTAQVIKNTVHVGVSGVFATFYFIDGTGQSISNPTLGSLKRALTYSFGSICFGSLIVAAIQFFRALLKSAARGNEFLQACVDCIMGFIETLVEYFNYYAYTQVAIYGKPFCKAAKDTWTMVKSNGIDAIINDQLIGNVLGIGCLLVGLLCCGIGYVVAKAFVETNPAVFVALISFLIGFFFLALITQVVSSGVATTFVCIAENPHAIAQSKPELYQKIRETYPEVMLQ